LESAAKQPPARATENQTTTIHPPKSSFRKYPFDYCDRMVALKAMRPRGNAQFQTAAIGQDRRAGRRLDGRDAQSAGQTNVQRGPGGGAVLRELHLA